MWSSSGGVTSVRPSSEQKNDDVGASRTRPCGVTRSASSQPSRSASRVASMFAAVGERLHAVEDAGRRVGDRLQRERLGKLRQRLEEPDPVPAARHEHAHDAVGRLPGLEERADVGADRVRVERQQQVRRRALHPREVVVERERVAVVQAHHLEDAVAAQQPLVSGRDVHLVRGQDGAVEDSEHGGRLPVVFAPPPERRRGAARERAAPRFGGERAESGQPLIVKSTALMLDAPMACRSFWSTSPSWSESGTSLGASLRMPSWFVSPAIAT